MISLSAFASFYIDLHFPLNFLNSLLFIFAFGIILIAISESFDLVTLIDKGELYESLYGVR